MIRFCGLADETVRFLEKEHLLNVDLWKKLVDVFRTQTDGYNYGWRGEYWGKMMRGAALVCGYSQSEELYNVLTDSVRDLFTVMEEDGRVSSYSRDRELDGWDVWSRKYVILGCEYYLEICKDEAFKAEIISFISAVADYVLAHIGDGEGKKKITSASRAWHGANSSSILEPIVRLYRLTGEKRYLDFAEYIIREGGADGVNFFELAYENKIYPYQYGVSKAYEMTSCFEGLLEYYEITGIEKYKTAVLNYAKAVMDSEISIIGSCGVTHELFDHTRTRQTARYDSSLQDLKEEVMQETCVTVTMMKFFARILKLTGDSVYADFIETAFYNAYLASLNTEYRESDIMYKEHPNAKVVSTILPFDSYCPLTPGVHGLRVGGAQLLTDGTYYGCCAAIGSAGVGIFLSNAVIVNGDMVTVNFYEKGSAQLTVNGTAVTLNFDTEYPKDGKINITVATEKPTEFTLKLRSPAWRDAPKGYMVDRRVWNNDKIELSWDMPIKLHYPEHWEEDVIYTDMSGITELSYAALPTKVYHKEEEDNYVALTRGPITLAADSRTGKSADSVFRITHAMAKNAAECTPEITDGVPCLMKLRFDGDEPFYLVDYAHAGRDWKTLIAAWLPTEK